MIRLRWTGVVLVILGALGSWLVASSSPLRWSASGRVAAELDAVRRSPVCELVDGEVLDFEVSPGATGLRLVSNAILRFAEATEVPEREILYGLAVELVDAGGEVIADRTHYFSARIQLFVDPWTGKVRPDSFLSGQMPGVVADGKVLPLEPPARLGSGGRLRLRLTDLDPVMSGVVVRLYAQAVTSRGDLRYRWQRMGRREREIAARGNLYPPELLTESERRHLLVHPWLPEAPRGVPGADYRRAVLYTRTDPGRPVPDELGRPAGLVAPGGVRLRLDVPAEVRELALDLVPADLRPAVGGRGRIRRAEVGLSWLPSRGPTVGLPGIPWDVAGASTRISLTGPGTLEVLLPADAVVRASSEAPPVLLEPEPEVVAAEACGGAAVEMPIVQLDERGVPLRITLRGRIGEGADVPGDRAASTAPQVEVPVELLDPSGRSVERMVLVHRAEPSPWDWVDDGGRTARVEEASEHYLLAPPSAAMLRVGPCRRPLLVAVYNRPPGLERVVREGAGEEAAEERAGKAWFRLVTPRVPGGADRSYLRLQRRPALLAESGSEDGLGSAPAAYASVEIAFAPLGRSLLVPRTSSGRARDRLLSSAFVALPVGQEVLVRVAELGSDGRVRPSLLFAAPSGAPPAVVRLEIDGSPATAWSLPAGHGSAQLPDLVPGEHRLRLDGPAAWRFFVNHSIGEQESWMRRTAYRFDGPVEVRVTKPSRARMTVTGRLFLPTGRPPGVAGIRGRLLTGGRRVEGPTAGYTFSERSWEIVPGSPPAPWVEGGATFGLDIGTPFFLPLEDDLPAGEYTLRLEPQSGCAGAHLALSVPLTEAPARRILRTEALEPGEAS